MRERESIRGMPEVAEEYDQVQVEIERVEAEIKRLTDDGES